MTEGHAERSAATSRDTAADGRGPTPASGGTSGPIPPEEQVFYCDLCGAQMLNLHCKLCAQEARKANREKRLSQMTDEQLQAHREANRKRDRKYRKARPARNRHKENLMRPMKSFMT